MNIQTLENWNIIFQFTVPILQFVLLIIPFLGSRAMYDRRRSNFFRRVSYRGYTLLCFAIILIISTIAQSIVQNRIAVINAVQEERNIAKRDSINRKKNEQQNLKIQEMLAKYGFTVNTKNDEIVKILRDPNLRKQTTNYGESPLLGIYNAVMDKEDRSKITFTIHSFDATSYDINVRLDILTLNSREDDFILLKKDYDLLDGDYLIAKDQPMNYIRNINVLKSYNSIFLRLHGSCKKFDGTTIKIDNYYLYDRKNNEKQEFGKPRADALLAIKNYYTRFGLK